MYVFFIQNIGSMLKKMTDKPREGGVYL